MRSTAGSAAPASVDDRGIPAAIAAAVGGRHGLELLAKLGEGARCGHHLHDRGQDPGAVRRGTYRTGEAFLAKQVRRPAGGAFTIEHQVSADRVGELEPRSLLPELLETVQVLLVRWIAALAWLLALDSRQEKAKPFHRRSA